MRGANFGLGCILSSTNGGFLIGDAFEEFLNEVSAVCLRSGGICFPNVCYDEADGDTFSGFLRCFFWRLLMHDSTKLIKELVSLLSGIAYVRSVRTSLNLISSFSISLRICRQHTFTEAEFM